MPVLIELDKAVGIIAGSLLINDIENCYAGYIFTFITMQAIKRLGRKSIISQFM